MVEEIIYTSAEKGLKQGSRGFCTVVSTMGMALNLAERLESMSGYRHAFPLHDPKASLNPVCWSHMTTRLAGRSLHVISRVADAGQDYTGRSNKLAHHLVIDNVAGLVSGPARMLAEPGVIADRWDGTVRHIPPRDLRSAPMPATIPLVAWKALTGDEGWAGSVAEQLLQSSAPVSIIFDPGTDTLTLVREVLDLIPAAQRWNVTFSTYFTRLLAGAECQLRFVLNDTPEATSLRNDARARVVDLTSPLPAATGGTLVAMARTGQLTPQEPAPPQATTATPSRASVEASGKDASKDTASEIAIPKLKPGLSPLAATNKPQPPGEFPRPVRGTRGKRLWIATALTLLLVSAIGTLILLRPPSESDGFAQIVDKTVPQSQEPTEEQKSLDRQLKEAQQKRSEQEKSEQLARVAAEKASKKQLDDERIAAAKKAADQQAERLRQEAMDSQARDRREAELAAEGPFIFIKKDKKWHDSHGQWVFEIPEMHENELKGSVIIGPQLRTKKLPVELELLATAADLFSGAAYRVELRKSEDEPVWTAVAVQNGSVVAELGEYRLHELTAAKDDDAAADFEIQFKWSTKRDSVRETSARHLLRWWPLKITVGDQEAVMLQRRAFTPETVPTWRTLAASGQFSFSKSQDLDVLPLEESDHILFSLDIMQGKMTHTIEAKIQTDSKQQKKNDRPQIPPAAPVHARRFFELKLPLTLQEKPPSLTDELNGYAEISVSARRTSEKTLVFHPRLQLLLRLPKQEFMNQLIASDKRKYLRDVKAAPEKLRHFDPNLAADELKSLQAQCNSILSSVEDWHTQPLKDLPGKEELSNSKVLDLIDEAIIAVQPFVESFPQVDEKNVSASENKVRRAVHGFLPEMRNFRMKIVDCASMLLFHYDDIKTQVDGIIKTTEAVVVGCRVEGLLAVPGAVNGASIRVIFLECQSVAAQQ